MCNEGSEEIRRSAHTLLETVTCVQDTSTLKPAVEKIVKDAYAGMGKIKSSGRELETTLGEFRKGLSEQGVKLEGASSAAPIRDGSPCLRSKGEAVRAGS